MHVKVQLNPFHGMPCAVLPVITSLRSTKTCCSHAVSALRAGRLLVVEQERSSSSRIIRPNVGEWENEEEPTKAVDVGAGPGIGR